MRLDKFFSQTGTLTRSQVQKQLKLGKVTVNGETIKKADYKVDPDKDEIRYNENKIVYRRFVYIMMNKPRGVVSATEDRDQKTVLDLLPEDLLKFDLFPCGRLDKDTTGLVVLTNDGISAHNALSPKKHVEKKYSFETADAYSDADVTAIESGITLKDGYSTKPCKIERISETEGYIYLTEGKYHEIKRLFGARSNKITKLERIGFGKLEIGDLPEGDWRYLTEEEISWFAKA
mgnify:FL=1